MDQRIRDFEPLWNAINRIALFGAIPPPQPLVRQPNEHHLLPGEALNQWWIAETVEERQAIMAEYLPLPELDPRQDVYRGPAPLQAPLQDPLDYDDPDADDVYDLEYAAY
jgi:hypothetical protein